jgi:hypothetical protein
MLSYVNYILFCGGQHTSLFTRCGTTECVPFLSVAVNRDLFSINTILFLLFGHLAFMLSNKSFQSMPSSYPALSSFNVRISINLPCVEYNKAYPCRAVSGHAGKQVRVKEKIRGNTPAGS